MYLLVLNIDDMLLFLLLSTSTSATISYRIVSYRIVSNRIAFISACFDVRHNQFYVMIVWAIKTTTKTKTIERSKMKIVLQSYARRTRYKHRQERLFFQHLFNSHFTHFSPKIHIKINKMHVHFVNSLKIKKYDF